MIPGEILKEVNDMGRKEGFDGEGGNMGSGQISELPEIL
jgi:hypothetical protein